MGLIDRGNSGNRGNNCSGALGALGTALQTAAQAEGAFQNTLIGVASTTANNVFSTLMGQLTGAAIEKALKVLDDEILNNEKYQAVINTTINNGIKDLKTKASDLTKDFTTYMGYSDEHFAPKEDDNKVSLSLPQKIKEMDTRVKKHALMIATISTQLISTQSEINVNELAIGVIESKLQEQKETVESPVSPAIAHIIPVGRIPTAPPLSPLATSDDNALDWLNTERIKGYLQENGLVDQIFSLMTEQRDQIKGMETDIVNFKLRKGLTAQYTTGALPYYTTNQ